MRRRLLTLAAAVVLAPAGMAFAGGFGHHVYNPHYYGGRAVRPNCGPVAPGIRGAYFNRQFVYGGHCAPTFFRGGCVNYGYGGFGYGYGYGGYGYGDTFGGFVNRDVFLGNGVVAVSRGRLTVGVPFQLPNKCGVGFGKKHHGRGFAHFSGVHNFYDSESSVADYASYYAAKRGFGE